MIISGVSMDALLACRSMISRSRGTPIVTREPTRPEWCGELSVICVEGSPMDCAAMMPHVSPAASRARSSLAAHTAAVRTTSAVATPRLGRRAHRSASARPGWRCRGRSRYDVAAASSSSVVRSGGSAPKTMRTQVGSSREPWSVRGPASAMARSSTRSGSQGSSSSEVAVVSRRRASRVSQKSRQKAGPSDASTAARGRLA
jgi:hypothetical protein